MVTKTSLTFLPLLLLLLLIFLVASSDAVPTSRSLAMSRAHVQEVLVDDLHAQDVMQNGDESNLIETEGVVERRMDIQTTDYPGAGANNHHDPRTPGGF